MIASVLVNSHNLTLILTEGRDGCIFWRTAVASIRGRTEGRSQDFDGPDLETHSCKARLGE